ncbi:MAG TPA: methyltransferase domain-containing protein [Amnibacterium sp.]|jgi:SAM-dependent methyltransferase|uniref:class I SAM-dependent methyltransferase n=1 Tax=Amnibacterium sp. TaxID=1872496 RepID=UPI002F94E73C
MTAKPLSPDQLPEGWTDGAAEYDTWFAPVTSRFAGDAVALLGIGSGDRVLDVAAGTGAFTLAAAAAGATVLAIDFADGMVDLLSAKIAATGVDATAARMDGQALDLADGSFDAAGSLFGLMFFPDMDAGVREMARVVRPGGRVVIGVWHRAGFTLPTTVMRALRTVVPGMAPPQREFAPFRLADPEAVGDLLTRCGLRDVRVQVATHVAEIPDPAGMFRAAPRWSQPLRPAFDALTGEQRERAARAFADLITDGDDRVGRLPGSAVLGVGTV